MIFLTGASGLLGRVLLQDLLEKGYKVRALYRNKRLDFVHENLDWVEGDLNNIQSLQTAVQSCDAIVHAAALVSFIPSHKSALYNTNVEGTRTLVNVALQSGVQHFIYISSVAALGADPLIPKVDETAEWKEDQQTSYYGLTKYLAELEVWRGQEEGLKVCIVQPSIILTADRLGRSSARIFDYIASGAKYYPRGDINFVDVRDVSTIVLALFEKKVFGEKVIAHGVHVPYKTFMERVAYKMGVAAPQKPLPYSLLMFFFTFFGFLIPKSLLSKETLQGSNRHIDYDAQKSIRLTGIRYRNFDETIDWCCSVN